MRTVSSVESFHSALNRAMGKNSHFFKLVVGLKLVESRKADKMFNLLHKPLPSNQLNRKHIWDVERDQKIKNLTELLCKDKISIIEFLRTLSDENSMYIQHYPPMSISVIVYSSSETFICRFHCPVLELLYSEIMFTYMVMHPPNL